MPFSIITTNEEVRRAWTERGPLLNGKKCGGAIEPERVMAHATDRAGSIDLALVAVQPQAIEGVTLQLKERLSDEGMIVCLSNGLCEETIANIVGPQKVVGAVVTWGARMPRPGSYVRTSSGGFLVGRFDEKYAADLGGISEILEHVGPVRRTENLIGARYSKLTINCAITALGTIGGQTLGRLLVQKEARNLALALMNESALVARAEGVELERVTKIDLAKLASRTSKVHSWRRAGQHALLLAVGVRYRRLRSSMLAAMERGHEPAIDHINGEVVARGKKVGVPTPFNQAATEVIWDIYAKRLSPGIDALREVAGRARP